MADAWHHAVSSARTWGGVPEDYLPVHQWFDETKEWLPDARHRAIRHHSEGIGECIRALGPTVTVHGNVREKEIPTRWVAEQHVREDFGRIPTAAEFLRTMPLEPWMVRGAKKLSRELEQAADAPRTPCSGAPR